VKQESDMPPFAMDSEAKAVNCSQQEDSGDVRSVLIVGAGPAGLMLAYVHALPIPSNSFQYLRKGLHFQYTPVS
jgi:hypothetical protein